MMNLLLVALGGSLGSLLRYGVQKGLNANFPTGTLAVNLLGCFLIGALWAAAQKHMSAEVRLFLMTGFCGGFTTFSAFTLESLQLMQADRWLTFGLYVSGSVTGGLLATFLGFKIFSS